MGAFCRTCVVHCPVPEYRIVFKQPPGGQPARAPEYLYADNDTDALEQAAARYTREDQVVAVHGLGPNRWSMWRVWVQG